MSNVVLYIATVLMWLIAIAGIWQRIFQMPGWFSNPPASFEKMRMESIKARTFWIPLSIIFIATACASLLFHWESEVRNHILAALAFYLMAGLLSGVYFAREIMAFSAIRTDTAPTPQLLKRTRKWLKWTTVRDILQWLAAISLTMACTNL
jgi:hypothetical protein